MRHQQLYRGMTLAFMSGTHSQAGDIRMANISYLTRIEFDHGAVANLAELARSRQIARPLIVTDRGIVASGLLDHVRNAAADFETTVVFDDTPSNPTEVAANQALNMYIENRCDGVIALGGGSPIDLAKAVSLLATHKGPLEQYAAIEGGVDRIGPIAPVIAVPTTSGTGSEVGRAALITLADGRKLGLISPHLIPAIAVCDPQLTLGLPAGLTAATGVDAISHCIETFLSPRINPVADAIALDGLVRLVRNIEIAFADGTNKNARWEMMMGALQGGLCFQKGLGAIHALSHPLGGLQRVSLHHGTLNAILLPHVLRWNEAHCPEKYMLMRERLGVEASSPLSQYFADLNARLDLPARLSEIGVQRPDLESISQAAVKDHSSATNPRPCSQADYLTILEAAF